MPAPGTLNNQPSADGTAFSGDEVPLARCTAPKKDEPPLRCGRTRCPPASATNLPHVLDQAACGHGDRFPRAHVRPETGSKHRVEHFVGRAATVAAHGRDERPRRAVVTQLSSVLVSEEEPESPRSGVAVPRGCVWEERRARRCGMGEADMLATRVMPSRFRRFLPCARARRVGEEETLPTGQRMESQGRRIVCGRESPARGPRRPGV